MAKVSNVEIYGLEESIVASGYPMRTERLENIKAEVMDNLDIHTKRAVKLAQTKIGEGHDNWLNGIIAQFDLQVSTKAWTQFQRYHFLEFVSSMSTMHRLTKMSFDEVFNEYVTQQTREQMKELQDAYNENPSKENKLKLLYNAPAGLEITARMSTNYRQLKTIYKQRRNHLLPDWQMFCDWIESLPYSYLITGKNPEEKKVEETPTEEKTTP